MISRTCYPAHSLSLFTDREPGELDLKAKEEEKIRRYFGARSTLKISTFEWTRFSELCSYTVMVDASHRFPPRQYGGAPGNGAIASVKPTSNWNAEHGWNYT